MIQRIQTLWLTLAALAALLTLKFSFYSGNKTDATAVKKWIELTATTNFIILVLTVGVAVTSIIVIFLYKQRKLQFRLTILSLVISILNLILYYNETKKFTEGNPDITALISLIIPVFLFFAARGIYKDEKLIKSADRLR